MTSEEREQYRRQWEECDKMYRPVKTEELNGKDTKQPSSVIAIAMTKKLLKCKPCNTTFYRERSENEDCPTCSSSKLITLIKEVNWDENGKEIEPSSLHLSSQINKIPTSSFKLKKLHTKDFTYDEIVFLKATFKRAYPTTKHISVKGVEMWQKLNILLISMEDQNND